MRKLWCAGAIASGILLLGAAPALAGAPAPAGNADKTLSTERGRAADVFHLEKGFDDLPLLGGLAGALPVNPQQFADYQSEFAGMPYSPVPYSGMPIGGSPLGLGRSATLMPDDGSTPATAPTTAPTPATSASAADPTASGPATPDPADSGPAASEPAASEPAASEPAASEPAASEPAASVPAASEPAASAPAASEPAATDPATATETPATTVQPSASASAGLGAVEKPRAALDPNLDDPRLHEEPVDGFVERHKK